MELKLKERKSANEMTSYWTVGEIHLTTATDLYYGTGYTGSAVNKTTISVFVPTNPISH